ncbi:MAG TPA: hypothetical protein VM283_07360 [Armatimonadota bacterium]|nr:hypothetical protein [Armatimonadota bacterium]
MTAADKVKLGWASRDITPDRPVALRGQFNLRIATRVNDPLTLTALAIEAGGEQAIIVSIDTCAVDQVVLDTVREALHERLPGFDPRKLFAGATHTHTAPFCSGTVGLQRDTEYMDAILARYPDYMSTVEYTELLTEALLAAVCEAWERRSEGHLGWGYSYAVVGENRRVRYFDDRAVMYGKTSEPDFSHIEGHVDHGVYLLFTYDAGQNLTGMVVNVGCPSQASESGQDFVSADFWHDVREEIRARFGADLFVLAQTSAAGDQSPHRLINTRAEERMMMLKYGEGLSRRANMGLRRDIARRIADAVGDAEPAARKELHDSVPFAHEYRTLDLPHWNVTDNEYADLQAQMTDLRAQLHKLEAPDPLDSTYTALRSRIAWCQRAVDRYENPPASVPVEVNFMRLGDVAFATAPFEYYLDFGDRIRGRSPALQTFVVQLAGGGSYLATERAARGLSYGAVPASCRVSPEGGQVIVDEAVATISRMFEDG